MLRPLERGSLSFRAISLTLAVVFLASILLSDFTSLHYAQGATEPLPGLPSVSASSLNLPSPNKLIELSPKYQPVSLRGLRFYPDDPLRLDFLLWITRLIGLLRLNSSKSLASSSNTSSPA